MLGNDPHDVYLLSLMSELCLQQDKIDQAASVIDTAIGLSPDSPDLFFIKARILLQQDKYDEAENFLQQAIAMDPEMRDILPSGHRLSLPVSNLLKRWTWRTRLYHLMLKISLPLTHGVRHCLNSIARKMLKKPLPGP